MRVVVWSAAWVVGVGACRANPGFALEVGEEERASTGEPSTGGVTDASSTGPAACEPELATAVEDVCLPWQPVSFIPPNLTDESLFADHDCAEPLDVHLKRVDEDSLQACGPGCAEPCDPSRALFVGAASEYANIAALLPEVGECVRLWHVGQPRNNPPCESLAYAMWDEGDARALRFAAAYGRANPFEGVAGLPLTVATGDPTICPGLAAVGDCDTPEAIGQALEFTFGECTWAAQQRELWRELVVDGTRYEFDLYSSYRCVQPQIAFTSWFLRRSQ